MPKPMLGWFCDDDLSSDARYKIVKRLTLGLTLASREEEQTRTLIGGAWCPTVKFIESS